ncbi:MULTISPECIES: hypothetical protein [Thalassospira]|uniref:Uncharacterized protein n=1 Tax=Thalassospira profundimaris TaxID=502049 RepID=A0A367V6G7_9PROT|nr:MULTISPECIES: hypothetical protein [Thalassospira]KZB72945.1 hypothetical protein AUQ43_02465 [Thalassospira sp. MCCC 1A01148]MBR9900166.1 hypothetical protein [Rhodospirillales bacterium]RCK20639.1 hypothetical protein TH6_16455 [Thalassospira profundimaris]
MSYPHHPYGYEPTHCPVIDLVPRRRHIIDVDCSNARDEPETIEIEEKPVPSERRLGFPFGCAGESAFGPADIEGMIEYVVATRQGWRSSMVIRSFLRWWRKDDDNDSDAIRDRKQSDAIIMLLALNQGRDGFVQGYLHDLKHEQQENPKAVLPENPIELAFNKSLRIAALALALSPIVLVFAVLLFVQIDNIISAGSGKVFGFSYDLLFVVGSFGAIGALTSMMMRLGKDVPWDEMEPASVFFNFLFRPCMGFCFAILVLLALRAGMLPIPLDELHKIDDLDEISQSAAAGQQISIVLVFAFLSGFSERLSTALVKRVEDRVTHPG